MRTTETPQTMTLGAPPVLLNPGMLAGPMVFRQGGADDRFSSSALPRADNQNDGLNLWCFGRSRAVPQGQNGRIALPCPAREARGRPIPNRPGGLFHRGRGPWGTSLATST